MWAGRHKLGDTVRIVVLADNSAVVSAPPEAPVLSVYNSSGTKVYSGPMAPLDPSGASSLFACAVRLGSSFAEGQFRYAINYQTAAGAFRIKAGHFQILGSGATAGNYVAGCFYRRPHADHLVLRTDADSRILARGPYE